MSRKSLGLALLTLVAALSATSAALASVAPGTNGRIAFARQLQGGGADVFTADPDGTNVAQVPLAYPAEDFAVPRWAPDGNRLLVSAVLRFDGSGGLLPFRPATVDPDGSSFDLLEPPNAGFDMACWGGWYPGAARLLCSYGEGPPGVFSINASDGGDPLRLTTYPFGLNCNACDAAADVSPDGRRFVFLRYRRENFASERAQQVALFVENTDGTGLRQLTPYGVALPHELASARWSPDGRTIVSTTTQGRLFTIGADGSTPRPIRLETGTSQYFAFEPAWSPDGTKIVFCMFAAGREDVYTADADGSNVRRVTDTPEFEDGPDWGTHPTQ